MMTLRRIPEWVLSLEESHNLFCKVHGTASDLIYAKGVLDSTSPYPSSFNKKQCTIILIKFDFWRDFVCDN
jgi:hypothetical protein